MQFLAYTHILWECTLIGIYNVLLYLCLDDLSHSIVKKKTQIIFSQSFCTYGWILCVMAIAIKGGKSGVTPLLIALYRKRNQQIYRTSINKCYKLCICDLFSIVFVI